MQSDEVLAKLAVLDRETIEQTIRDIHLLRAQAKYDALERYLAPEAEYEFVGSGPGFPFVGKYIGKSDIIDMFKTTNTEIEVLNSSLLKLMIEGDQAFTRRRVDARHRGTGLREVHEIWNIWKFRDGLVEKCIVFLDVSAYARLQGE